MPIYDHHTVLEVARGVRAFLNLSVGVTRGEVPGLDARQDSSEQQNRLLRDIQGRVNKQRRLIERQRRQLEEKDHQIAELKARLASGAPRWLDNVSYEGSVLPPKNLRPCGENFQDDGFYLASAKKEAEELVREIGLGAESRLLDVGSGPGRLAIGILETVGEIREYKGVDVVEEFVLWGQHHITPRHPNFQFLHVDVENTRYNPHGKGKVSSFVFPFEDEAFDIIVLYSVFTHMLTDGVRAYLREFHRILRPDGRIFLTAFVEDGVPDVEENPPGYLGREWKGALLCVRYNRKFFEKLLEENGFRLDRVERGGRGEDLRIVKQEGQSGLYVSKATD